MVSSPIRTPGTIGGIAATTYGSALAYQRGSQETGDGAAPPGMPLPPPKLPPVQGFLPPSRQKAKAIGDEMDDEVPF